MEKSFDIITFDCYGTLIDWEGGITRAFQKQAALDGLSLNTDEIITAYMSEEPDVETEYRSYREVLALTSERVAARLGLKIRPEHRYFLADSLPDWVPFLDTNPGLERLARKFKLGLLSNIDDELLSKTREHFTVKFDLIVTAEQVRSYKPGHAHFREGLSRAGDKRLLHAAQSYYHDVVPTRALNIPVLWVNRKREKVPENGVEPTGEVRNITELADLLGA
jgi:2-haloalkanoic acid dehalogenase type II